MSRQFTVNLSNLFLFTKLLSALDALINLFVKAIYWEPSFGSRVGGDEDARERQDVAESQAMHSKTIRLIVLLLQRRLYKMPSLHVQQSAT